MCRLAQVTLEPGAFPGDRIVFANMGSQTPGEIPGDVTVVLKQQKHERGWARHGNDLVLPINLTVREALLGFDRMIRHIGGNTVQVGTSSVTRPGQLIKVAGRDLRCACGRSTASCVQGVHVHTSA